MAGFILDPVALCRTIESDKHNDLDYTLRTMGIQRVLIAGASTDNTVLWTAADTFQKPLRRRHRRGLHNRPQGRRRQPTSRRRSTSCATSLHTEILSLDDEIAKYLSK